MPEQWVAADSMLPAASPLDTSQPDSMQGCSISICVQMQNAGRQASDDKPDQQKGSHGLNPKAEWHSLDVRPKEGEPGQVEGAGGAAKAQSDVERVRLLDEPALHGCLGGMAPQGVHTGHDTWPAAKTGMHCRPSTYLHCVQACCPSDASRTRLSGAR